MDQIKVDKAKLIKTLKRNRKKHREIFLRAQETYRQRMIEELDRALDEAKNGGKIIRAFSLPVPEDHTDEFDTVIQMMEWHEGNKIWLTEREVRVYIKNDWGWQASFAANTASYLAQ